MSDSVRPHRWPPTRLPHPWDSPGKNTGVCCRFLLQCMKVKSQSEFAQSCPTLSNPMDCCLPGSSVHGIFQARVLEWGAIAFSRKSSLMKIIKNMIKAKCWETPIFGNYCLNILFLFYSPLRQSKTSKVKKIRDYSIQIESHSQELSM